MSRSFTATMLRAIRLMRARKQTKTARELNKVMAGFMAPSVLAALKLKPAKSRKAAPPKAGQALGTVLKQLSVAQSLMSGAATPATRETMPGIPKGGQYLARTHRSAAGSRDYKLYLPASQPKRPKGLILMLHGCSQTPDDFAAGTHMNALAEKHDLCVAYPAQIRGHNAASCWNWFSPRHQIRGAGEPAILASLTRKLMKELGLGRDAVFVAGLSAGGAMAMILADLYPDIYSAAGIHSGLARGSARDLISAMSVMRHGKATNGGATKGSATNGGGPIVAAHSLLTLPALPALPVRLIIFQGTADSTVHPANAAMIVDAAVGGDAVPTKIGKRSVGGRGYARSDYAGPDGATLIELWMIEGAGHAWSGGRAAGSYTDRTGPDASAHMIRFFTAKAA
ncbi:extracellular catalytic domain type 1 short-chain-length polyhydroxyalkanoate depolymerase [Oceanibaculum nanhaiense]|uniref:extracellular catalytic domain type 1 short-chain-length polyhydroxyalkanoate depolymerase n=1 Tax=Oceanibaculum nanhaiense TaxID=1909734 RepID=UPI000A367CF5|nr:PHB depolymerase family esterase [Oceanibaculum nanhaiense]